MAVLDRVGSPWPLVSPLSASSSRCAREFICASVFDSRHPSRSVVLVLMVEGGLHCHRGSVAVRSIMFFLSAAERHRQGCSSAAIVTLGCESVMGCAGCPFCLLCVCVSAQVSCAAFCAPSLPEACTAPLSASSCWSGRLAAVCFLHDTDTTPDALAVVPECLTNKLWPVHTPAPQSAAVEVWRRLGGGDDVGVRTRGATAAVLNADAAAQVKVGPDCGAQCSTL